VQRDRVNAPHSTRDPPSRDLLRRELADRAVAEDGDRLSSSQRSFSIVTGSRVMLSKVCLHQRGDGEGSGDSLFPW
jgi:hypothetical protein